MFPARPSGCRSPAWRPRKPRLVDCAPDICIWESTSSTGVGSPFCGSPVLASAISLLTGKFTGNFIAAHRVRLNAVPLRPLISLAIRNFDLSLRGRAAGNYQGNRWALPTFLPNSVAHAGTAVLAAWLDRPLASVSPGHHQNEHRSTSDSSATLPLPTKSRGKRHPERGRARWMSPQWRPLEIWGVGYRRAGRDGQQAV